MAKGTGGTIYLIGLIFAIIVAFALLGIAYYMNTKWAEVTIELAEAKKKYDREHDEVVRRDAEIANLNKIINGGAGGANYDQIYTQYLAEANRKLQEMLSEEWILTEEWRTIKDPTVKETWEKLTQFKDKSDKFMNLIDYQQECLKHLQAVIHVVPRLRIERFKADEALALAKEEAAKEKVTAEAASADLRDKLAKEQDKALEQARNFDKEKRRLTDQIEKLQKEQTRLERDQTIAVTRLENEIKKRQLRIDELTKKQRKAFFETAKPDGEITYADAKLGYGWIDLGKTHGLRRGTRFQVYQFAKGGRQKVKGVVEVKKVEQDMSQVAIIEGYDYYDEETKEKFVLPDPNDPIVKGDLLRSPVFEKDAQPKFYFLGQKLTNRYYNMQELERKIDEFGGKVLKELSVEVDYVVVLAKGEEDTKNYEKAIQFGVTFMKEEELLDYVGK
jgi:uncharacterized membrane-anchored protein YhcB (DUF1043 family)